DRGRARLRRLRCAVAAAELGQHDLSRPAIDPHAAVARLYSGRVPVHHGARVQPARRALAGRVERRVIAAIGTAAEGAAIDAAVPLLETRALTVRIGTGVGAVTAV